MVDIDAALFRHFLELAVADRIRHKPADVSQAHVTLKMTAFELDSLFRRNRFPTSYSTPFARQSL
jgi:hypothetical protein